MKRYEETVAFLSEADGAERDGDDRSRFRRRGRGEGMVATPSRRGRWVIIFVVLVCLVALLALPSLSERWHQRASPIYVPPTSVPAGDTTTTSTEAPRNNNNNNINNNTGLFLSLPRPYSAEEWERELGFLYGRRPIPGGSSNISEISVEDSVCRGSCSSTCIRPGEPTLVSIPSTYLRSMSNRTVDVLVYIPRSIVNQTTNESNVTTTTTEMPGEENMTTTTTTTKMPGEENVTTTTTEMPGEENVTTTTTTPEMPGEENMTTTTTTTKMPGEENMTTTTTTMPGEENVTTTTTEMPGEENMTTTTTTTEMPGEENVTTTTTEMPGEENVTTTTASPFNSLVFAQEHPDTLDRAKITEIYSVTNECEFAESSMTHTNHSAPLLLILSGGDGNFSQILHSWINLSEENGFIVAVMVKSNCGNETGSVALQDLETTQSAIDGLLFHIPEAHPFKVVLVGIDGGARISEGLACSASDQVRGVVAIGGVTAMHKTNTTSAGNNDDILLACDVAMERTRSRYEQVLGVEILRFHGEEDTEILFKGENAISISGYPSVENATARWSRRLGCSVTPNENESSMSGWMKRTYPSCTGIQRGEHPVPHSASSDKEEKTATDSFHNCATADCHTPKGSVELLIGKGLGHNISDYMEDINNYIIDFIKRTL